MIEKFEISSRTLMAYEISMLYKNKCNDSQFKYLDILNCITNECKSKRTKFSNSRFRQFY